MKNQKEKTNNNQRGSTKPQKLADIASRIVGSWWFIGFQTALVVVWVSLNGYGFVKRWDPYPFIFLNLSLSIISAYAAPIILMSQNRAVEHDRTRGINDLATDRRSEREIQKVSKTLSRLERKVDELRKSQ